MGRLTSQSWQQIRSKKLKYKGDVFVKKRFSYDNFIFKVYRNHEFEGRLLLAAPDLLDMLRKAVDKEIAISTGNYTDENMKDWIIPAQLLLHKIDGELEDEEDE